MIPLASPSLRMTSGMFFHTHQNASTNIIVILAPSDQHTLGTYGISIL